jgi:hypothetical protein
MINMEIRYPIWFCEVEGRVVTPNKPRPRQKSIPKPSVQVFKVSIPVKFYPFEEGETPIPVNVKSTVIQKMCTIKSNSKIVYDKILLITQVGDTKIKE